jgi:two-component system, LytTR family, response regulator
MLNKKFSAILVDDAPLIRAELKLLLGEYPEIKVIGEASSVDEAVALLKLQKPDVIFLDIQLKGETGFDLLERTDITFKVIFVTAYDQYAIRAFEINALDYLLKPIKKERLFEAVKKLSPQGNEFLGPKETVAFDDVIYLMIHSSFKFIKIKLIKCIIAAGKYSYIYYGDRKNKDLVSKTLLEWENILPSNYFVRIHRSTIINFEHVEKVVKRKNYTHEVYVSGIEAPFIISRRFASKIKRLLCL